MIIEYKNIVRKISLAKLGFYEIKDNKLELFDFIEKNLLGLKEVLLEQYLNYILNR